MDASTTRKSSTNSNGSDSQEKKSSQLKALLRSASTLEGEAFYDYIQQKYGAISGTFKFEDSLSDYSNEVIYFSSSSIKALISILGSTISLCR